MKTPLRLWQTAGFLFVGISGVLLHFLFDWTKESLWVASFSAVNESIWEHMKLLFFPMFLFALVESRYLEKVYGNFWCVKALGIFFGVLLIPVSYYTVNGAIGDTPDFVNIAIFFLADLLTFYLETRLFEADILSCRSADRGFYLLFFLGLLFVVLTFITPRLPIFSDPITKTYGYFMK